MILETERLLGHPVVLTDLGDFLALFQDEGVGETMNGTRSEAEVAAIVDHDSDHWKRHGYGHWTWRDRATGSFVGRGGLRTLPLLGQVETEVGYAVVSERWGEGLATEIASVSVTHAFESVGLDGLVCFTLPSNVASRRVMEKAGFAYDREFTHADLPHVLYRLASSPAGEGGAS